MRKSLMVLSILVVTGCSPIYTPETDWWSTKPDESFRPDLAACVQQFDPAHISEMDNDGEYEPSGFFVDTARTQSVVSCMEAKGWDAERPDWYHGPTR